MHEHHHDHGHDHDHPHGPAPVLSLPVAEEPLDPANQSLVDALRVSFRALKVIMAFVVIAFLFSGFSIVKQNEVVVLTRFGRYQGEYKPGLLVAWPYPIDEKTRVPTDTRTLEIRSFWMSLAKEDETKPLSQIPVTRAYLQPGVDGALLTSVEAGAGGTGAELVHVKWDVSYRIVDFSSYVQNVRHEASLRPLEATIRAQFDAACVAMAARATVDEIAFTRQGEFRARVHEEAQRRLDGLGAGIRIEKVNATPYQPLQVRDEFDAVIRAQNEKEMTIQSARQEHQRILSEAAGEAHERIYAAIVKYEQAWIDQKPPDELNRLERRIRDLLSNDARGTAADIVKTGIADRDQIVQQVRADAETLRELKPKYDRSPGLLRARLWQQTQREIFASDGVTQFFLPDGVRQFVMWLNRDAEQQRELNRKQIEAEARP